MQHMLDINHNRVFIFCTIIMGAVFNQQAQAACTTVAKTITCEGGYSGVTSFNLNPGSTYINNGNWADTGIRGATIGLNGNQGGALLINNGSMTWSLYPDGLSPGTYGILGIYATGIIANTLTAKNNGEMTINYSGTSLSGTSVAAAIALGGPSNTDTIYIENKGLINVFASGTSQTLSNPIIGVAARSKEINAINTGTFYAQTSGPTNIQGFTLWTENSLPRDSIFQNTGDIILKSTGTAGRLRGAWVYMAATSGASGSSFTINNDGNIRIDAEQGIHQGIAAGFDTAPGVLNINNSGTISVPNTESHSIIVESDAYPNPSRLNLINTGEIIGRIQTNNTLDYFEQTSGSVTGDIDLGAESDTLLLSGGAISGSIYLGAGDDTFSISNTADVASILEIDGGNDFDTLNIDTIRMRGFTSENINNTSPSNSTNLNNLESINLTNGAELDLINQLFTSANPGNVNLINASSLKINSNQNAQFTTTVFGNLTSTQSSSVTLNNGVLQDTLNITGDYHGDGTTMMIDTQIQSDASKTDKVVIEGRATGSSKVIITNINGQGDLTVDGIPVIQTGSSESNNTFSLIGSYMSVGAYDYSLNLHKSNTEKNSSNYDNWHLQSTLVRPPEDNSNVPPNTPPTQPALPQKNTPLYTPTAGSYITNNKIVNEAATMRLEDREGSTHLAREKNKDHGLWSRSYFKKGEFSALSKQIRSKGDLQLFQLGVDLLNPIEERSYKVGLMGSYASYDGHNKSDLTDRKSSENIHGYTYGSYFTWYENPGSNPGAYIDLWAAWSNFKTEIKNADNNKIKYKSSGLTASIESGITYLVSKDKNHSWWLQPQLQITYQGVSAESFSDDKGSLIKSGHSNWQYRAGIKNYLAVNSSNDSPINILPYVSFNAIHNTNPASVKISGETYAINSGKLVGEIKLGVEAQITDSLGAWLNISHELSKDNYKSNQGNLGVKYNF